jgi:hypothetical protein
MRHPKRTATGLLLAGLGLAVGTPLFLAFSAPDLAGYLLHPAILLGQTVPYVVCACVWLPRRAPAAAKSAVVLATLLLLAALVLYPPMLATPGARGGDMIGMAFIAISAVTTGAVLVGSAVALLVLRMT